MYIICMLYVYYMYIMYIICILYDIICILYVYYMILYDIICAFKCPRAHRVFKCLQGPAPGPWAHGPIYDLTMMYI